MANDHDVWHAYLAGAFDTKGSIGLSVQQRPQRPNTREYRLRVELSQHVPFRGILDRVRDEFGGSVTYQRGLAVWTTWTRAECRQFLEALLPHLIVKRERAETALAYLELVAGQPRPARPRTKHGQWAGRTRLNAAELSKRQVFYERMLELNKLRD